MTDTDTTTPTATRSTAVRVAVVAAVAAVGFGGAVLAFGGDDDAPPSGEEHAADPHAAEPHAEEPAAPSPDEVPFEVAVDMDPDPPQVEGTAFGFEVTLDGEAVTGADVEFWADMDGHAHDGISATATEVDPGRYEIDEQRFAMRGDWSGQVRVSTDEGSASTPVRFTVE